MSNDKTNANRSDGGNSRKNDINRVSELAPKTGQQSQDAQRYQQNAAHHKYHGKQPQAGAQQNDDDLGQTEAGQQPEIPKVGSRDAPGG